MKNILMSGLGGSLFPYLHNQIKKSYTVYYVDMDESLKDLYPEMNFIPAPKVNDDSYFRFIKDIIEKYEIDIYIPLIDEEIVKAHEINRYIPSLTLISPTDNFSRLVLNKYDLMKELDMKGISEIITCKGSEIDNTIKFPIFVKPIFGRGSRGIREIISLEEFDAYITLEKILPEDILVQELIEGQEYTVGVLTNNKNDILSISSKRVISKKGITIHAVTENNSIIESTVFKINSMLKPCGPYNVQLFLNKKNEVKVFEINPRFSTTSIMSYAGGVNEIDLYMSYKDKKFKEEIIRPKENIYLRRSWRNNFYE